jgi:hypothetical protein
MQRWQGYCGLGADLKGCTAVAKSIKNLGGYYGGTVAVGYALP